MWARNLPSFIISPYLINMRLSHKSVRLIAVCRRTFIVEIMCTLSFFCCSLGKVLALQVQTQW